MHNIPLMFKGLTTGACDQISSRRAGSARQNHDRSLTLSSAHITLRTMLNLSAQRRVLKGIQLN